MKILIAYYSRTGITEKVAEIVGSELNADIERIDDNDKYKGPIGYMKGGKDAMMGKASKINPTVKDPADYDLTIIASPVWASRMAPGVRTYIEENKDRFQEIAGFATCGSSGGEKTLEQISEECGKPLAAEMIINSKDLEKNLNKKINSFINKIIK